MQIKTSGMVRCAGERPLRWCARRRVHAGRPGGAGAARAPRVRHVADDESPRPIGWRTMAAAQSVVTVTMTDATGQPFSGQRLAYRRA